MAQTLTADIKGTSFSPVEALLVATSKVVTEGIIARTPLGNGTLLSGIGKMAVASLVGYGMGKNMIGRAVATGMVVDGAEDIISSLFGRMLGQQTQQVSSIGGGNSANVNSGVPSAL